MDGIAVRARDTNGATETAPLGLKIGDQAVWVDTGDPMPDGYNAVIMVEHVHEIDSATVEIMAPVPPYHHVRALGEDIVATELLLPESHILRPVDVGACAAAGLTRVQVRRRPSVGVLPTGTELVAAGSALRPGEIVEFNSLMLAGLIDEWGGLATRHPPIPDDYERLKSAVLDLVRKHDIVVINAGSSAGSEDYTASLVEELGDLIVHGVAYRPGHPVVLGVVDGKPVLGIPGYPVSAVLTCEIFVKPLIERKLGVRPKQRERIEAILSRKVASPIGEDEHLRVALGRVSERMIATPIQRGAGVITSLVRADGLVTVPRRSEGVEAGALVEVELLRHREEIERKIVATGSHDLTLDLLASRLRRTDPGLTLSSSNVGSLGGLMALSRREAHLAGIHLMDEATGEYNIPFVRKYLKRQEVVVVHLVGRVQGLMVTHGNPEDVSTLSDLAEDGMSFVNRQRGSGTRVLLDYKLKELGIEPAQIAGYEREEYTHLGVAAAVAGGRANTGLGILSAARAMGLEFVPLVNEQYDLVIPAEFYGGDLVKPLLDLIRSAEFRSEVEALGGYDASAMGEVVEGSDGD
jgi:putative molybdopterin biosynthesis protein